MKRKKRSTFGRKRNTPSNAHIFAARTAPWKSAYGPNPTPDMLRKIARRAAVWNGARA